MRFILACAVGLGAAFSGLLAVVFLSRFACLVTGVQYGEEARMLSLFFGLLSALGSTLAVFVSDASTEAADAIMAKMRKGHRETRV